MTVFLLSKHYLISLFNSFQDEEFQDMINTAAKQETACNHCFDQVIVNDDLNKAVNELTLAAHCIETEPQWVPAAWMR